MSFFRFLFLRICSVLLVIVVLLFGLALIGDGIDGGCHLLVGCQVVMADRTQIAVQFVDEWNSGGNVEFGDLIIGNVVQILHQSSDSRGEL